MRTQYVLSKTIDFDDVLSKKVTLKINGKFENKKALLIYADDKKLGISTANSPVFKKGVNCVVEFLYIDNILSLESTIKSFEDGILFVSIPRNVSIRQQRGDLRILCDTKCYIEQLTTGKIKNLSAGGAFVSLDTPIDFTLINKDKFKLCFTLSNFDLRLTCQTIESSDKFIRVKFIDTADEVKDFITNYCCLIDAENYRRSKQ